MRIDLDRLDAVLAERVMKISDLRGNTLAPATIAKIRRGEDVGAGTARKLARALGVPLELLTESRVVIDRVKLMVELAQHGWSERHLIGLAGLSAFGVRDVNKGHSIPLDVAQRIADTLDTPLNLLFVVR
ncbi:MAG: hypothetical protein FWF44_10640 [Defluviitaleaceae bacterium]|nr:hypothetical protein [Defluviitaleaceae bacterium]